MTVFNDGWTQQQEMRFLRFCILPLVSSRFLWKVEINGVINMKVKMNARTKIMINNNTIEQVKSFNYLGYTIIASNNRDLEIKSKVLIKCAAQ
jgi:hypothetical protein